MFQECKHKDRLMHAIAITNMEKEPDLFYEALENFRKYGAATANNTQVGGQHYKKMEVQPWDVMGAWMTKEQFNGYLLGSALAYIARVNAVGVEGNGGKWFVSIQTEREMAEPAHPSTSIIGIDVGITRFATLSDGSFIAPLNTQAHQGGI